ncbi:Na+/H+ antiporter NhaC family protein [Alloalcanivorax xenomutans]|uniref:Na+/H+ antiporter NhaC family protein n=1 Tax=Alloalcanivorax xenomutans TaxID=1094342 RepID=UPI0009B6A61F|nr:Na+/H+ antiporter NhaC family protein [Alloalcanivorax xenomutans]ARB47660.1 sodium:proton antiporter [Alloalcanivorax xenomutans]
MTQTPARAWALIPLLFFLVVFLGSGLYFSAAGAEFAFYQIKAPVVAVVAIVLSFLLARQSFHHSVERLLVGVGHPNIILMCLVFLLAGAFASVSKSIGSVDATVQFGLQIMPASWVLPALFLISAFIATAMGTSMGTIAATAPIAVGFAEATSLSLPLSLGAVVGGAMLGDNLSMISDTTIAATRSQGVSLKDKFRVNVWIALPAALATVVLLALLGDGEHTVPSESVSYWRVMPYLLVFALALSGMNVLAVLVIGIVTAGLTGVILSPEYGLVDVNGAIYQGFESMFEIMLLSMLIGGLSQLLNDQGGTRWLIERIHALTRWLKLSSQRAGEIGIALLVVTANLFVANNTVSIVLCGEMAKEIAAEYGVDPRRSASVMDIFSCVVQGLIPYGAQVLLACSIASLSPLSLIGAIHYCWALGLAALLAIAFNRPRLKAPHPARSI